MTSFFRKLENIRHWDDTSWLGSNNTQADVLKSFNTSKNELSIYVLEEADAQIDRVVAALAATRDSLNCLDLAVVPIEVLGKCQINSKGTQGLTPDNQVNGWHQNLIQLTISKIVMLSSCIKSEGVLQRYQERDVEKAVQRSLAARAFDVTSIKKPKFVESLRKRKII